MEVTLASKSGSLAKAADVFAVYYIPSAVVEVTSKTLVNAWFFQTLSHGSETLGSGLALQTGRMISPHQKV